MNEGWASMETLLNEEMPTKTKDNNYKLVALFVLCAFVAGIFTGTKLDTKGSTAEVIDQTFPQSIDQEPISYSKQISTNADIQSVANKKVDDQVHLNPSEAEQNQIAFTDIFQEVSLATNENLDNHKNLVVADFNQAPTRSISLYNELLPQEVNSPSGTIEEEETKKLNFLSLIPFKKFASKGLAAASAPKLEEKANDESNWIMGFGMNTGVNMNRNTKVVSLNSDWMYKLGKNNAVGVQVLYAAEDEFEFSEAADEPVETLAPSPKGQNQSPSRNPVAVITPSSKQYRLATGLIIQQDFGYRFYSNFAFGVDMLQNRYVEVSF